MEAKYGSIIIFVTEKYMLLDTRALIKTIFNCIFFFINNKLELYTSVRDFSRTFVISPSSCIAYSKLLWYTVQVPILILIYFYRRAAIASRANQYIIVIFTDIYIYDIKTQRVYIIMMYTRARFIKMK